MQNINAHTVEIAESWLPSVRALGSMRADINELRVALRLHLMQDTAEGKDAAEKRLASLRERIETDPQGLREADHRRRKSVRSTKQWTKAWADYLSGVQEVMAMSRKSVGRFPTDANELLQTKVAKMAQAADPLLLKGIELNNRGAETGDQAGGRQLRHRSSACWSASSCCSVVIMAIGAASYLGA